MRITSLLLIIISFLACTEENILAPPNELKVVQFDLQYGFEDKYVSITVDTTNHFSARLSPAAPLAGPLATFTTPLEKGEHMLIISTHSLESVFHSFSDTTSISIGESQKYFIGIQKYPDSTIVQVQDSSFFYI